jgi:16S rRNA (guanine1207-N2)-methyltransferase
MATKLRRNRSMRHYFLPSNHKESEYFTFSSLFNGVNFVFRSCPDVFSKDELDYGSLVLVKSILEHKDMFGGKIMDMCCGYGTIAILLSKFISADYYLSDINSTAIELAKYNVVQNNCKIPSENIEIGNLFDENTNMFNHVVSNPPIKAGKKYLLGFVDGAYSHLENGGTLTLVIKKNLGADSLKKYLISLFGNCEVWERDRVYYILHSKK